MHISHSHCRAHTNQLLRTS